MSVALEVIRTMVRCPAGLPGEVLAEKLQQATKDDYQRTRPKKARYNPEYKDKPAAGEPRIHNATAEQKQRFQEFLQTASAEERQAFQDVLQPAA